MVQGIFDKGDVIHYSKKIFHIASINGSKITLVNVQTGNKVKRKFQPYELQKIDEVQKFEGKEEDEEPEHKKIQAERKKTRVLKKAGVEETNIVRTKRVVQPGRKLLESIR